jgi:hypothetical protein
MPCNHPDHCEECRNRLIPADSAAALAEHDAVLYSTAHQQGFDAGFDGAERAAFEREREYVARYEKTLAEEKRKAEASGRASRREGTTPAPEESSHPSFAGCRSRRNHPWVEAGSSSGRASRERWRAMPLPT